MPPPLIILFLLVSCVSVAPSPQTQEEALLPFVRSSDRKEEERKVQTADEIVLEPEAREEVPDSERGGAANFIPVERNLENLDSFYRAIDELRRGKRDRPVRIMWLGDSHTAADFMTQRIRLYLNEGIAQGGPGFVRLGLEAYRHGAVRLSRFGTIRKAPILPAQRTRVLDGVFGYGGIRTLFRAGSGASVELRDKSERAFRWTISYRLPRGAELELQVGDKLTQLKAEGLSSSGAIYTQEFQGSAAERLSIRHLSGAPEVLGVFCEYQRPGVVLDTVGINGARTATTLAWEPAQFISQLRERSPELLVIAFGTNEVFDRTTVAKYREQTIALIDRARQAIPELPCWVVGPPDSARKGGGSQVRVQPVTQAQREAAAERGCAFSSLFELMGGEGSFTRWSRERPARARSDRIHLTIRGYRELGDVLASELLPMPEPVLTKYSETESIHADMAAVDKRRDDEEAARVDAKHPKPALPATE